MLTDKVQQNAGTQPSKWIVLVFLFCALSGGSVMFAIRQTINDGVYPIYGAAALRFSIAGGIFLLLWALGFGGTRRVTIAQAKCLATAGLASAASHWILYYTAQTLEGGPTNAILALTPFVAGFMAWGTNVEPISRKSLYCKLICGAGVVLLSWARHQSSGDALTLAAVSAATLLFAVSNLRLKQQDAPVVIQASVFFASASPVLWFAHWRTGASLPWPPPLYQTSWLAYTTLVVSGLSFALYLWLLQRTKLMNGMSVVFLQPVIALAIDARWEIHPPTPLTYLSVIVIALGLALDGFVQSKDRRPLPDPPARGIPEPSGNGTATATAHDARHQTTTTT